MTEYNEELLKSGVMLAGEGLHPTSKGAKVRFNGSERTVIDGPFTEAKELVAGYWIWECASRDEAIEWLKRAPFDGGVEIELREVFQADDFGEQLTPELSRVSRARTRSRPRWTTLDSAYRPSRDACFRRLSGRPSSSTADERIGRGASVSPTGGPARASPSKWSRCRPQPSGPRRIQPPGSTLARIEAERPDIRTWPFAAGSL